MAELLSQSEYSQWDQFVAAARGGTIFHLSWYLAALADDLRIYVVRDKSGQIAGGLAVTPLRFLGTTAARRTTCVLYNGPLLRASAKTNPHGLASEYKNGMVRLLAESPPLGMYDYILPPEWDDMMPFIWNGFDVSVGYTYQIAFTGRPWQADMEPGHAKDLRRAHKAMDELGGTIVVDGPANEFYTLACDLANSRGYRLDFGRERFARWCQALRDRDAGTMYVLRDGAGQPIEGVITVRDANTSFAILPGSRAGKRAGPAAYVQRLLIERAICDAHARGLNFDFSGTVMPKVEPYFRGWGGRCLPKYRAVKIRRPWTYAAWALHGYWTRHRQAEWFS